MVNIGGKYIITKGIVTVICSWTDYEGQLHTNKLNTVLNLPDSSVNILSDTILAESMNYDDGTWVLTKRKYHIYTWGFLGLQKGNISPRELYSTMRDPSWI